MLGKGKPMNMGLPVCDRPINCARAYPQLDYYIYIYTVRSLNNYASKVLNWIGANYNRTTS